MATVAKNSGQSAKDSGADSDSGPGKSGARGCRHNREHMLIPMGIHTDHVIHLQPSRLILRPRS
jgi:hypothetical protein